MEFRYGVLCPVLVREYSESVDVQVRNLLEYYPLYITPILTGAQCCYMVASGLDATGGRDL